MSLINEALKRTEAEKLGSGVFAADDTGMAPIADDPPSSQKRKSVIAGVVVLGLCISALVGLRVMVNRTEALAVGNVASQNAAVSSPHLGMEAKKAVGGNDNIIRIAAASLQGSQAGGSAELPVLDNAAADETRPAAADKTRPEREAAQAIPAAIASEQQLTPSDFKLSGTMQNIRGGLAIINGRFIYTGEIINGAKLIKVGSHSVDLEAGGQVITIRM